MTGETILACRLQGRKSRGPCMTLGTLHNSMLAVQFEGKLIVIEIVSKTIHSIMAVKTIVSIRHLMLHHEGHIDTDVALSTG